VKGDLRRTEGEGRGEAGEEGEEGEEMRRGGGRGEKEEGKGDNSSQTQQSE